MGSPALSTKPETYGSNYAFPSDPTRTGYTFSGWYNGGDRLSLPITNDVSAEARWEEITGSDTDITSDSDVPYVIKGDFEYNLLDNGTIEITAYRGSKENVVIPAEINGFAVAEIGENAFADRSDVKSVTLPEGVTSIGYMAFSDCKNLATVVFPETLTTIGE